MHDPQDKAKRHLRESILRETYSHSPEARRRGEQSEAGYREDAQDGRVKFSWSASPRGPAATLRERDTRREARGEPHGFLHRDLDDGEATAMLVARITEMRDELGRLMRDNAAHEQSALDTAAARCADDRPYTTQDGNTATYHFSADAARILPPALSPASRRHHYTHPGAEADGASPGARRRHAAHEPELYDEKWWPRKELGEPVSDLSVASGPARPRHWGDRDVALVEEIDFLHAKIRREREKKAKRNTALLSRNPSSPGQGSTHPQLRDPSDHSGEYYYDAGRNLKYKPTSQDLQSAGWDMEAAPVEVALPLTLFVALYRPHGWEGAGADESLFRTLEKEGERGGLTRFTLCLAHDVASAFEVASDRVRVERVSALRGREERDVLTAKVYLLTSVLQVDAVERRVVDVFNRHKKLPLRKASRVFDEETGVPAQCVLKTYRSKIGAAFAPDELEGYSGAFSPFPRTTARNASASPQRENSDSGSDAVSSTGSVTSASATSASGDSRRRRRRSSRSRRRRRDDSDGGARSPSHSRRRRRRDGSEPHSPHSPGQSSRRRHSRSRRRRAASEDPDAGNVRRSPYAPVAEPLYSAPAAAATSETETGSSTFSPFAPSAPTPATSTRRSSRRRRGSSRSRRGGSRRGSSRGSSRSSTGAESAGSSGSRRSRSRRSRSRRGGDRGSSSPYPQQPSFKAPPSEASPSRRSSRRRRRSDSSDRSASPAHSHRPSRRSVAAPLPQPPLHKSAPAQPYPQSYAKLPPRGGEESADHSQAVPMMPAAQPPPLLTSDDDGRTRRRRRRDAVSGDEDAGGNGKRERRRRRRSEQESEAAAVGSHVEVHSLVQSYELNGRRGTVTGVRLLSDGEEALAVAMDDGSEEQMLRRQNLRVVDGGGGGGDGGRTRRRRRRSPSASSRTEPLSPSRRGSSDVAKSPGPPPGAPRVKSLFVKEAPPPGLAPASQPAAYPQRQPSLAQTPERQIEPSVGFARGTSASTRRASRSPALAGSAKRMT